MRLTTAMFLTGGLLAITACSGPEDSEYPANDEPAAAGIESVEPQTEASAEQRRERLREEMARHRQQSREAEDGPLLEQRRTRGEQREPARWWADEVLAAELGLAEDQLAALDQAAARHRDVALEVRSELVAIRRQESDDEAGLDADLRDRARERLAEADRAWLESVNEILDEDQLEFLATHRPEALRPAGLRPRSP